MKRIKLGSLLAVSNSAAFTIPTTVIPCMWIGSTIGDLVTHKHVPLGVWIIDAILLAVFIASIVLRILFYAHRRVALKRIRLLVQTVNGTRGWMNRTAQRRLREQSEAFAKVYGFYPVEAEVVR